MKTYALSHLSDHVLLRELTALVAQDRTTTAAMLAHLAEVDARRLCLPAGYPSMYAWCVGELKLSEEAAFKRIHAARVARQFPAVFPMLADGRLNLSGVILLAPHLSPENANELLAASASQSKIAIERLLAERFPRPDVPTLVAPLAACESEEQHAPGRVILTEPEHVLEPSSADRGLLAPAPIAAPATQHAPGHAQDSDSRAKLTPLSPGKVALQVTITQATQDKLRYAQALLGHAVPSGDLAQVLDRALDALIAKLEQRRFARSARQRPSRPRRAADTRYVPAEIRRMVWQRDGGRCSFVGDNGHQCETRARLEFDHVEPFARGGRATVGGLRLRCRAHNQLDAERAYGAEFMRNQRDAARRRSAESRDVAVARAREAAQAHDREAAMARAAAEVRAREVAQAREHEAAGARDVARSLERERAAAARARVEEVLPWLRALGVNIEDARRAAAPCADMPDDSPLEARVRVALRSVAPHGSHRVLHAPSTAA